jgi:hypothetical protein
MKFNFKCSLLGKKNQDENFRFAEMKKQVTAEGKEGIRIAMINRTIRFTNQEGLLEK